MVCESGRERKCRKNIIFLQGGKTRQQSTYNALNYLEKQNGIKKSFIPYLSVQIYATICHNQKSQHGSDDTVHCRHFIEIKINKKLQVMSFVQGDLFDIDDTSMVC